ncbi:hypothetical protein [Paraferrimonas haliotis]|uniref:Lipoprotein n=1 Tax=Paraferrimonas haliotis TaxID=2013866 RepID=A0AA37TJ41_9GAMM|nr:hypothetical protein [Paraferrimonas haliotis]GLS82432.1 lipoprotein [Paraferrimonas haliotis]
MNKLTAVVASLLTLTVIGCSSDDDELIESPPITPAPQVINIANANELNVTVEKFDPATGLVRFSIADDNSLAVTDAKNYHIVYFGFPDSDRPSANPKAWKRWHVYYQYQCAAGDDCDGVLTETVDSGHYQFEVQDLDWDANAVPGAVQRYQVGIRVSHGDLFSDFELANPAG